MTKKKQQPEDDQAGIEDGMLRELLDEEEVRLRKAEILRRLPEERKRLRDATKALRAVQHRSWLAVSLLRDDLLHTDEAKETLLNLKLAIKKQESKPLIKEDKVAIVGLDIGAEQLEHELAKMAVEASEADHKMLNDETIWYASIRKQTGAYVPIEQGIEATYDAPVKSPRAVEKEEKFVPPVLTGFIEAGIAVENKVPEPLFPENPRPETVLDAIRPDQIDTIRRIGIEKVINTNGMCYGLMQCGVEELSEKVAEKFIKYLEAYVPVDELEKGAESVSAIYGGQQRLSDVREPQEPIDPPPLNMTVIRHPDGTTTVGTIDDAGAPF